ncbi:MAG: response regulator [Cyclobacteriaceae bacterium]
MGSKILYVDDEKLNLMFLQLALKEHFELITVSDPLDALKMLLNQNDFKAVISDWKMPQMSGIAFIHEARKFSKNIPYFMLSGYNPDDQIAQMLAKGVILEFFQKPTNVEKIIGSLKAHGVE